MSIFDIKIHVIFKQYMELSPLAYRKKVKG